MIFLFGGKDLEMETIKEILQEKKIEFYDKRLGWGNATLSQYKEVIDQHKDDLVVTIELREDTEVPTKYLAIDHHNERNVEKSSIEQVADFLGLELNRYQQLVAANDKAYIPGMMALGASQEEINEIRLKDRRCQGVTEEEEATAVEELKDCRFEDGVAYVKTTLNRFSPFTDRLFGQKKIVAYNEHEICYYGPLSQALKDEFRYLLVKRCAYYGGAEDGGYFGLLPTSVDERDRLLEKLKELI